MQPKELLTLLKSLVEEDPIGVYEQIAMEEPDGTPLLNDDGSRVIYDVVQVGDGRLYIQRDWNEPESEQLVITLLGCLGEALPVIIEALETTFGG